VEPIRVAIFAAPGVLRDVIATAVAEAGDMTLVASDSAAEAADVLIELHDERQALLRVPSLLARRARPRVMAIAEHGRESVLWALQPRSIPLHELSRDGVLQAIRAAVRTRDVDTSTPRAGRLRGDRDPFAPPEED
jgi:hypothetical protein